jgi:hypothetical protein
LLPLDYLWQRHRLGDGEEDERAALDEGSDEDLLDGKHTIEGRNGNASDVDGAGDVADDHHPLAIHPIHQRPRWQAEQDVGNEEQGVGDTGHLRRVSDCQDKERHCQPSHVAA